MAISKTEITTFVKNLPKKTPLVVGSKVLGAATIASIIYDAHVNGREKAYTDDEIYSAERYTNLYKQYMTSSKESATLSQLKKGWFVGQQSSSWFHFTTKARGYITGFGNTILNELPRLAVSSAAIAFKKVGLAAGAVLAGSWAKTFLISIPVPSISCITINSQL